jgi:GNAT superfamily N-acetyltransferase
VPHYFVPGLDVDRHAAGIAYLEARGYVPGSDALALDSRLVTLDLEPYLARLPSLAAEGLTIGTPTWAQVPALLRFLERETPHDWLRAARDQLQSAGLDDFTVACHNDAAIGYCQNDGEHFGPFGVSDGWRGQGLGTVILAHRLAMMRAAGRHHAWVLWTSQSTWERVYQRFGFTLTRRFRLLSKPLA